MKGKDMKKKYLMIPITIAVMMIFTMTAYADGDVAGAVQSTWSSAQSQIKTIVDNVVFPIIDVVLAVLLFVKLAMSYLDYRKHGQFEWGAPAILFGCLLFSLTAPLYLWSIVGM